LDLVDCDAWNAGHHGFRRPLDQLEAPGLKQKLSGKPQRIHADGVRANEF
jgi:hypothetical protein